MARPRRRRERRSRLARLVAPVAFLAAATIAVLLIRAGLRSSDGAATQTVPTAPAPTTAVTRRGATTTRPRKAHATYYTVQTGDTYGTIAEKFGTTVAALEALNPGISSNSLSVGQRIRVK